jgi:glycosyltransferase involved in cell wall biosynthesis
VTPLVSVVVPVHNGERFLADALRSIREQAYADLEVLVVDDGSTDGTAALLDSLGPDIRALHRPQGGPAAARNDGLRAARGAYVAFLDADDLWPTGRLHKQVHYLEEHPRAEVVLGRVLAVDERGAPLAGAGVVDVHLGCAVFRRSAFDRVGLFDESLRFSEDHDWFFRARELGLGVHVLDRVTLHYRVHAGGMTRQPEARDYQLPRVLKRSLDRRRAAGGPPAPLPSLADLHARD